MKHQLVLAIVACLLVFTGCYYDKEEELYEHYYAANACDTASVSWQEDIWPLIQGHCATTGCHVAGGTGNGIFSGYDPVKAKVDNGSFHQRVVVQRSMPPSGSLTECQLQKIQIWLDAGAPNN